jgi:DNA repair exonuclease SbcCD ATPase subunit
MNKTLSKVVLRLALGLPLSFATSQAVVGFMSREATQEHIKRGEIAQNQQTQDRFAQLEDKLRQQYPAYAEKKGLEATVAELTSKLEEARQRLAAGEERLRIDKREEGRELRGDPGYVAGPKARYRKALDDATIAEGEIARAQADISLFEPRLRAAQAALPAVSAAAQSAQPEIERRMDELEKQKKKELLDVGYGPLTALMAFQELKDDPKYGPTVRTFEWIVLSIMLAIEMSFVLSMSLTPASLHMVRLRKETKLEAAKENADFEMQVAGLPRPSTGRGPLRIVSYD